ncbi:MAG TPA: CBS domain-containing protein [Ramlibacter sp.]|jgi:CBS domain-containing protein|nr:CBS domain-containing protein [Ramlibacter sp.]
MVKTELTMPELGLLVGTRGMLGLGIGLLVADRLRRDSRRGAGWTLAAIGAFSTIPLAWMVYRGRKRTTNGAARVRDIMSRNVQVVSPEANLAEAARQMRDGNFGMMPVGENDRMVGAISDRDIAVRAVARGLGPDAKVREVMSTGICWAYDDDPVTRAAEIMSAKQIRRLPIVNHEKRLVGIVALGDIAVEDPNPRPATEALTAISEPA